MSSERPRWFDALAECGLGAHGEFERNEALREVNGRKPSLAPASVCVWSAHKRGVDARLAMLRHLLHRLKCDVSTIETRTSEE